MGFTGKFAVYRAAQPFPAMFPDLLADGNAEPWGDSWPAGWQVWRLFDRFRPLPDELAGWLRDATHSPAVVADVIDSDAAHVFGAGLQTPDWELWLELEGALGHLLPPPAPFDDEGNFLGSEWTDPAHDQQTDALRAQLLQQAPGGIVGASAARAWAFEAGLTPLALEDVAAILGRHEGFAEEQFFELMERLGLSYPDSA